MRAGLPGEHSRRRQREPGGQRDGRPAVRRGAAGGGERRRVPLARVGVRQLPGADRERRGRDLQVDEPLVHEGRHRLGTVARQVDAVGLEPLGVAARVDVPVDDRHRRVRSGRGADVVVHRHVRMAGRPQRHPEDVLHALLVERGEDVLQLGRVHVLGIVVAHRHDHGRAERVPERVDERQRGRRHGSVVLGAADRLEAPARLRLQLQVDAVPQDRRRSGVERDGGRHRIADQRHPRQRAARGARDSDGARGADDREPKQRPAAHEPTLRTKTRVAFVPVASVTVNLIRSTRGSPVGAAGQSSGGKQMEAAGQLRAARPPVGCRSRRVAASVTAYALCSRALPIAVVVTTSGGATDAQARRGGMQESGHRAGAGAVEVNAVGLEPVVVALRERVPVGERQRGIGRGDRRGACRSSRRTGGCWTDSCSVSQITRVTPALCEGLERLTDVGRESGREVVVAGLDDHGRAELRAQGVRDVDDGRRRHPAVRAARACDAPARRDLELQVDPGPERREGNLSRRDARSRPSRRSASHARLRDGAAAAATATSASRAAASAPVARSRVTVP